MDDVLENNSNLGVLRFGQNQNILQMTISNMGVVANMTRAFGVMAIFRQEKGC